MALKAGHLAFKREQLFGMKNGISLKMKVYPTVPLLFSKVCDLVKKKNDGFFTKMQIKLSGFVSDLTIDVKNVSIHPTSQSNSVQREIPSPDGAFDSEYVFNHNEDEYARSPRDSPAGRTAARSPSRESESHYDKSSEADAETHRWGLMISFFYLFNLIFLF